jgi:hypothetical protein
MKMKTYYYTVTNSSTNRGHNVTINAFELKNGLIVNLGDEKSFNTAAWGGDRWGAIKVINCVKNHKTIGGYEFASKNIQLKPIHIYI